MGKTMTRGELTATMRKLYEQHDALMDRLDTLEAKERADLDTADLDRLLSVAQERVQDDAEAQALRLAIQALRRRFDALGAQAALLDRAWAMQELTRRQPELDRRAAKVANTLQAAAVELEAYLQHVEQVRDEIGLTPHRIAFSRGLLNDIQGQLERHEREAGHA